MEANKKSLPTGEGNSNTFKSTAKDRKFQAQQKRVFRAFFGPPKSMLEVEVETGVMRSNICWFVKEWQDRNSIQRVITGVCSITKMQVGKYSTNPMYWQKGGSHAG